MSNTYLNVPGLSLTHRPTTRGRNDSIDDLSDLAPELESTRLVVELTGFASGNFSEVYGGIFTPPGQEAGIDVAVKVLRIPGTSLEASAGLPLAVRYGKHLGREVTVWQKVTHHRITPFIGYIRKFKNDSVPCIVTKRRRCGNLSVYLTKNPDVDRIELLCQALEGLIYLHGYETPITHFDIKPENILITDIGEAELADFGYAKVLGQEETGYTTSPQPGGTVPYLSPEVLEGKEWKDLTTAADIFAMGSTILFTLSGQQGWYYIHGKAKLMKEVSEARPPLRQNTLTEIQPYRPAPERIISIDDVAKLAPELDRAQLVVEPAGFASGNFSEVFGGIWTPPGRDQGIEVAVKVLRIAGATEGYSGVSAVERYGKVTTLYRLELALEGLVYLHEFEGNPIIHLDIKPENILVTNEGEAEVCDFGYAKLLGEEETGYTTSPNPGGTYPYMAPEVLDGEEWKNLTPAADIFAVASTLLLILSGQPAWYYIQSKARLIRAISEAITPTRGNYSILGPEAAVATLWDLLRTCWKQAPEDRPPAREVLAMLRSIQEMGEIRPGPPIPTDAVKR
ncbi:LRR receptor-like serine/threonine-protein kinase fls2 [Tulasnella sp. 427]|nr:LRR receptor-like serine/threonine-protein kinase fls2 [Tulasnella sp. 427]